MGYNHKNFLRDVYLGNQFRRLPEGKERKLSYIDCQRDVTGQTLAEEKTELIRLLLALSTVTNKTYTPEEKGNNLAQREQV